MGYIEVIGWIGASLILLAYILLTHHNLSGSSRGYQLLNLFGAAFLGIFSFNKGALPSVVLNSVWVIVGLYGLFSAVHFHKKRKKAMVPHKIPSPEILIKQKI